MGGSGLRVVIDSNMLESDELRAFLSDSPSNRAILTGYAWQEAYRHDPVQSILQRLSVLKDFPRQVDVLKGAQTIAGLDARAPGFASRMIRRDSAANFSRTIEGLRQAALGERTVIDHILKHGQSAKEQADEMMLGVPEILAAMPEAQEQMFDHTEIQRIRTSNSYTPAMTATIFGAADQIGESLLAAHPGSPQTPSNRSKIDTFLYRYALAIVLHIVAWIQVGSPKRDRHDKVHNDIIDMTFATFGTYFNGLMSRDRKALNLYWNLRGALTARGVRIPMDYVDHYASR